MCILHLNVPPQLLKAHLNFTHILIDKAHMWLHTGCVVLHMQGDGPPSFGATSNMVELEANQSLHKRRLSISLLPHNENSCMCTQRLRMSCITMLLMLKTWNIPKPQCGNLRWAWKLHGNRLVTQQSMHFTWGIKWLIEDCCQRMQVVESLCVRNITGFSMWTARTLC